MKIDRAELAGTGIAVAFHAALIAALSLSLAHVAQPPEPPSMEVELVDEVGLQSATPAATPPPPSQAPEEAENPPPPEPTPMPQVVPTPAPRVEPAPTPRPQPVQRATPPRPAPAKPALAKPVAKPRTARIGDDFLKGISDNAPSATPARPAAASVSPAAMAGIQQAIRRQVQPCADRQVNPGPGASRIKVKLHLMLSRSGRLTRQPEVVATSGVDDDNMRYEERVKDLAVAIVAGCSPINGLPQDLYQTANGGWSNFNMTYSLP